jgi:Fe2+ or Zn2+ uptake regulation protein
MNANWMEQITEKLHRTGGRMTAQRRLILETLTSSGGHPSAEDIFRMARSRDASLNLSTVYRTLRWLEKNDYVNPRWFEEDRRRERFDPANEHGSHHHFRCRGCNQIIEFQDNQVDEVIFRFSAGNECLVESGTLTLYGYCPECRKGQA